MFIKKSKYTELLDSVEKLTKNIKHYEALVDYYEKLSRDANIRLSSDISYINNYLADNFNDIRCNKLRNFVREQVKLLIVGDIDDSIPPIAEFDSSNQELVNEVERLISNVCTLDSYLGAEGLTIRKK